MGNCWFMPHLRRIFMILYAFCTAKGCAPCGLRLDSCSCSPSIAVPRHQACHGTGHTQLTEVIKQLCSIPFVRGFWGWRNLPVENLPFCLRGAVLSFCFFKLKSYNMYIYIYGFLMIMASCSPIGADTCLSSAPKSLHNESWPRVVYLTYNKGNGSHILYSYTRLSLYHDISCDITPHHIFVCLSYQMFMSDTQLIVLIHQRSFLPKTGNHPRQFARVVRLHRRETTARHVGTNPAERNSGPSPGFICILYWFMFMDFM